MNRFEQNAAWIVDQLQSTGKTATALAEYVGVTPQAVTKWKRDGHISTNYIFAARDFFGTGVVPGWLNDSGLYQPLLADPKDCPECKIDQNTLEKAIENLLVDVPELWDKPVASQARLIIMQYEMIRK